MPLEANPLFSILKKILNHPKNDIKMNEEQFSKFMANMIQTQRSNYGTNKQGSQSNLNFNNAYSSMQNTDNKKRLDR